jgi:quinoprotein glucose dehydrogenase
MATITGLATLLLGLTPGLLQSDSSTEDASAGAASQESAGQHGEEVLPDEPVALAQEASQVISRFVVPEGFRVELFAAEPLLAHPVAFTFDVFGRAYVAETFRHHKGVTDMREHMEWLEDDIAIKTVEQRVEMFRKHEGDEALQAGYAVETERVTRVEDRDGDGVADASTPFAEGFTDIAAGIGAGVLTRPLDGDGATEAWYTCIPDVWRLTDGDGDGLAEGREQHTTGYGLRVALLGHDLHGPIVGPDGRIYFTSGDRGFNVTTAEGKRLIRYGTGAVFSCELDGSDLQLYCDGLRNPQEIVFDDRGNLFTLDNNSDSGDKARWTYLLAGSDSGWRQAYQWANEPTPRGPWNSEGMWKPFHGDQPAFILPPIANFTSGPSGMTIYPGTGLGEDWRGKFFVCDFRGNPGYSGIYAFDQSAEGAGFALGEPERFVWDALPTDVEFGVDGNLYWSDWVTGWNQTGKGRLYRAVPVDRDEAEEAAVAATRAALLALAHEGAGGNGTEAGRAASLGRASGFGDAELVDFFAHRDRRVRQEAQLAATHRALAEPTIEAGVERLASVLLRVKTAAEDERGRIARLHALWALGHAARRSPQLGEQLIAPLSELFTDDDPEMLAQLARVFGSLRWGPPAGALVALVHHEEPRVRLLAAEALGGLPPAPESLSALVGLLESSGAVDPWLRHGAIHSLERLGDKKAVHRQLDHPDAHVRRAVAVVMRRWKDPLIARLLGDPDRLVRAEAARAIYDGRIVGAMTDLAEFLAEAPEGATDLLSWRRAVHACREVGTAQAAVWLADFAASFRGPASVRAEAVRVLTHWTEPLTRDGILRDHRPLPGGSRAHIAALDGHPLLSGTLASGAAAAARSTGGDPKVDSEGGSAGAGHAAFATSLVNMHMRWPMGEMEEALNSVAASESLPAGPRRAALQGLLDYAPDSEVTRSLLETALEVVGSPLRALAFGTLLDDEAALMLLEAAQAGPLGDRAEAVKILATLDGAHSAEAFAVLGEQLAEVQDGAMQPSLVEWLEGAAQHPHAEVKAAQAALLDAWTKSAENSDPYSGWLMCLAGGDVAQGRKVFATKAETSCTKCHIVGAEGGSEAGPALDDVGERLPVLSLLESIVEPNKTIAEGFQSWILVADGESFAGRIIEETEELILLETAQKEVLEFTPQELEFRRRDVSAMPADVSTHLSRREMRDLLAYLQSLKGSQDAPR